MYWVRTPMIVQKIFPRVIWEMNAHIASLVRMPSCRFLNKKIYLTFDDGPHPTITPWVLEQLRTYNIKATFFCLGENIEKYPHVFEQIKEEGHTIGNHGYSHYNGWKITRKQFLENYEKGKLVSGSSLFRPPYAKIRAIGQFKKGELIVCSVLPHDYHPKITPERCLANIKKHLKDEDIIVLHDSEKAWTKLSYVLPECITPNPPREFR
jgi:peptidoglycan/xylan/chitin deacetylase (PgdA/CDA1 family)